MDADEKLTELLASQLYGQYRAQNGIIQNWFTITPLERENWRAHVRNAHRPEDLYKSFP